MNVKFSELRRWANNLGIKCRGLPRWEIEELMLEEIHFRISIEMEDSLHERLLEWYEWMETDEEDAYTVADDTSPVKIPKPVEIHCSFCGKDGDEVHKMITGPAVNICNECVDLCVSILDEDKEEDTPKPPSVYCGNLYRRKLRIRSE